MKGLFILFRGKKQSIPFPLYFYKILTKKNGKNVLPNILQKLEKDLEHSAMEYKAV